MNNSTKKFIISNSFYALSEILAKSSESQENESAKNTLFGLSIAAKIGMNIFIVKGVFDKLNELRVAPNAELQEIIVNRSPSPLPTQANAANLVNLENARM